MSSIIAELESEQIDAVMKNRTSCHDISPSDTVRVRVRITEGQRTRIQAYEGVCIAKSGKGLNQTVTIRKISYGEGVERVFPLFSPIIEGFEIVKRGRVRRAKLYYLRKLTGKAARIPEKRQKKAAVSKHTA